MQMLDRKPFAGLVAGILTATCLGFAAGGSHRGSERGTDVTFNSRTLFSNGDILPAGTYRMEVPENSQTPDVTFFKDGKVVATIKATVVTQGKKNSNTEIDSVEEGDAQVVKAIRPAGWNETLSFWSSGQYGSANASL
jgi:hypothetical protein